MSEEKPHVVIMWDEATRQHAIDCLRRVRLDKPKVMRVSFHTEKRSLAQNRLMWFWYECLQKHLMDTTGVWHSTKKIHAFMKNELIPVAPIEINGKIKEVQMGTSEMNTVQMSDYLNNLERYCFDTYDLVLPHPEDLWREAQGRAA